MAPEALAGWKLSKRLRKAKTLWFLIPTSTTYLQYHLREEAPNLPKPQLVHLQNGYSKGTYLIKVVVKIK